MRCLDIMETDPDDGHAQNTAGLAREKALAVVEEHVATHGESVTKGPGTEEPEEKVTRKRG